MDESVGILRPAAAATAPMTAEEEAVKRNTDCVYFLASPLTCKKGNECEYRHSEAARVNPRDCWYWLNATCMNPKCAFRHPPLDGLFGGAPPTPAVPHVTAPTKIAPSNKLAPCYYFKRGNCMKGDMCPFTHGPTSSVNNPPSKVSPSTQLPPKVERTNPNPNFVANNRIINNSTVSKDVKPAMNFNKPIGPKSIPRAETLVNNKPALVKCNNYKKDNLNHDEHLEYPNNQVTINRGSQVQNREFMEDSRDGSEFLGESSPGFDVLVDHDEEDSSRFLPANEENHHVRRAHDEMYPLEHDYEILPRQEFERNRERYHVPPEQDYHRPEFERNKRPRRENSHERDLDGPSRRRSSRNEMDSEINGSDLRFRLMSKKRKVNGSRDEMSRESRDHRREDRHRNERRVSVDRVDKIARGTRLEGRIKMPDREPDLRHLEMDRDNRRRNFRVSPVKPREITRPRSSEFVGVAIGRPGFRRIEEEFANFAGPKSLRELKGGKMSEKVEERRGSREREESLDFEGPKPLSVILKRKREAAGTSSGSSSENKFQNDDIEVEIEEGMIQERDDANMDMDENEVEEQHDANDYLEGGEEYKMEEGEEEIKEGKEEHKEEEEEYYEEEEVNEEYQEGAEEEEYEDDEDDFAKKVGVVI